LREEPKHISEDDLLAWPIIVAWIHYVSIMLMIASLLGEHLLLKQELTAAQAGTVQRLERDNTADRERIAAAIAELKARIRTLGGDPQEGLAED